MALQIPALEKGIQMCDDSTGAALICLDGWVRVGRRTVPGIRRAFWAAFVAIGLLPPSTVGAQASAPRAPRACALASRLRAQGHLPQAAAQQRICNNYRARQQAVRAQRARPVRPATEVRGPGRAPAPAPLPAPVPRPAPSVRQPTAANQTLTPPGEAGVRDVGHPVDAPSVRTPTPPQQEAPAQSVKQAPLAPLPPGVDGTVFGIGLLQPLNLPACLEGQTTADFMGALVRTKSGGSLVPTTTTCRIVGQGITGMMAMGVGRVSPRGNQGATPADYRETVVSLPKDKCPDWLSGACVVTVSTLRDSVVAVSMMTRGNAAQSRIEKALSQKYNSKPTTRKPDECERDGSVDQSFYGSVDVKAPIKRLGERVTWELPSLRVQYLSTEGSDCAEGVVYVVTKAYLDALAALEEEQPKM